jgi:hypothetical protein
MPRFAGFWGSLRSTPSQSLICRRSRVSGMDINSVLPKTLLFCHNAAISGGEYRVSSRVVTFPETNRAELDAEMKIKKVTKAVFPVAGLGTRFLPATKSIPKEIMTLVDRPLIQYAIDEARAAGIKEFIFVTSRGKSALEDYFDSAPELESALRKSGKDDLLEILKETNMDSGAIAYIRQNRPLGLGHAVWCARRLIGNEPFAVLLCKRVRLSCMRCSRLAS